MVSERGGESILMNETVVVGLLSLIGSLVGTVGGIIAASKLTNYRIAQLEQKVSKHNGVIERTYRLEGAVAELQHDVRDLKDYHKPKN